MNDLILRVFQPWKQRTSWELEKNWKLATKPTFRTIPKILLISFFYLPKMRHTDAKRIFLFYANKMNGDKIDICNKHLRWIARRAGWTSLGIKGSGRSRKNSLSKVATSCTPVSMESVICPPRSNSSRNCVFCQKRRSSNETSELHFLCCLTFATTLIVKLHLVILSPHEKLLDI